jgi:ubiquinone biosynthesis protein
MNGKAAGPPDTARHAQLSRAAYPRLMRILAAIAKAGWGHYFQRVELPEGMQSTAVADTKAAMDAVRLRETIESLGPTFVKFGQLLSLRRDLLPDAYIEELVKLQDRVPPGAASDVRAFVEEETGLSLDAAFSDFDSEPFAAASMAEVYNAVLADGTPAVVKVQRAGIAETITPDIGILFFLARQLERHVPESRRFSPTELVEEFAESIVGELDFRREGRNADRFRENFKDDAAVLVPRIYWDLTTVRLLTMQRSPGRRAPQYSAERADLGRELAERLVSLFLKQVFEHGFFHGDPHPGNVFVLDDGRLCFHDFGIVGTLAEDDQEHLAQLMLAVTARDSQWVADAYFAMGVAGATVDRRALVGDLEEALTAFYDAAGHGQAFSEILRQFIRLGQRHRIRLPRTFLMVARAFMQAESHALLLDPGYSIVATLQSYAPRLFKRLVLPGFERAASLRARYRGMRAARTVFDALPDLADRLADGLRDGTFHVELRDDQLRGMEERIERASNRVSFSMIIASIVVASAVIMSLHTGPHYEDVSVLGAAGFVIAGVLGLGWAAAVLRSGKL